MVRKTLKSNEDYKPVVGGRASICQWELQFYFITKEQTEKFIHKLLEWNMPIDFNYRVEDVVLQDDAFGRKNERRYVVELNSMCWAKNLTEIGAMLEEVDYDQEDE